MPQGTTIGSGRYEILAALPSSLPRILRHRGRDTILDRPVAILALTDATPHRQDVLDAAAIAARVSDKRLQRVHDIEADAEPAFIVTEPPEGRTLAQLVEGGLAPAQARAIIGEAAEALDVCSRRGLHHLALSPESVRVRPSGTIQLAGVGIEAAVLGLNADPLDVDPLAADRADAKALVTLLYFALTGRWPGKRPGTPSAPLTADGAPVPPSRLSQAMTEDDADLDALVARTFGDKAPISAAEVARSLRPWQPIPPTAAPAPAPEATTGAEGGVLARLRGSSTARALSADAGAAQGIEGVEDALGVGEPAPSEPAVSEEDAWDDDWDEEEDEDRSSRRTTTAVLVTMLVVLLIGVVIASTAIVNLSHTKFTDTSVPAARTVPSGDAIATTSATSAATKKAAAPATTAAAVTISSASILEPASNGTDHSELAANLIDGNATTTWYSRYYSSSSLAFKQGIGIGLVLKQASSVSSITMTGTGTGGAFQIRSTSSADPTGGTLLAQGSFASGTTTVTFNAAQTSNIVIWVTELPKSSDNRNKITISEITLK